MERGAVTPLSSWYCNNGFLHAIGCLAVGGGIQAFTLVLFAHAQTDGEVDQLVGDEGDDPGPDQGHANGLGLNPELRADALEAGLHLEPVVRESRPAERR